MIRAEGFAGRSTLTHDGRMIVSWSGAQEVDVWSAFRRWRLDGLRRARARSTLLRLTETTTAIIGSNGRPRTPVDGAAAP